MNNPESNNWIIKAVSFWSANAGTAEILRLFRRGISSGAGSQAGKFVLDLSGLIFLFQILRFLSISLGQLFLTILRAESY